MSRQPLPRVFSVLAGEKDPAVDDALRTALPFLEEDAREAALKIICERARPATLAAMLVDCARFEPPLQQAIYRRFDQFHPGLRIALQSEIFEERAAVIAAIVAVGDFKSAYLLTESLHSRCAKTQSLAASALRQLVQSHLERREQGIPQAEGGDLHRGGQRLGEVLKSLIKNWDKHQRAELLEAALWMIETGEESLEAELERVPCKILPALERILSQTQDPKLAGFVLRALAYPKLKNLAARRICTARDRDFVGALLEDSWLLADHRIEHGYRSATAIAALHELILAAESMPKSGPAVVRLASYAGGARDRVTAQLADFMDSPLPQLKQGSFWRLVQDDSPESSQALGLIAARSNDARAKIAEREVRRRQRRGHAGANPGAAPKRANGVRQAITRFLEEHDHLGAAERTMLADQLKSLGPDVAAHLRRSLQSQQSSDRLAAIRALATLGLVEELDSALYRCARDADVAVRCAALTILAEVQSPTASRILRDALGDPHPRVQATAIEAVERRGVEQNLRQLQTKLESANNRVRANAIKALWKVELCRAPAELEKMLKDQAPEHRLSALWVVERLRVDHIIEQLMVMSREDPQSRVRNRARRLLGKFQVAEAVTQ